MKRDPWPPTPAADNAAAGPPPSRAEIEAELADHLATAAEDAAAQDAAASRSPRDLAQRVRRQFGNPVSIAWRCWWIGHQEEIMFRSLVIGLLTVFGAALVALAYQGWQSQQAVAQQMSAIAGQLGELADAQRQLLAGSDGADQDAAAHTITGRVYRGTADHPAAEVELTLRALPSFEVIRRMRSDAQGDFSTGRLPPGDYAVIAPLSGEAVNPLMAFSADMFPGASELQPFYQVQSRPLTLPGEDLNVDLDVELNAAEIDLVVDEPLPTSVGPHETIRLRLTCVLRPLDLGRVPWCFRDPLPDAWPLRGVPGGATMWGPRQFDCALLRDEPRQSLGQALLGHQATLPAGRYEASVWISLNLDGQPENAVDAELVQRFRNLQPMGIFTPAPRARPIQPSRTATVFEARPDERVELHIGTAREYLERLRTTLADPEASDDALREIQNSPPLEIKVVTVSATVDPK